ncbi:MULTISPECIES: 2-keto-4-pentenoate hydratase [Arthrobacter]|uniref:Fumarylacetoacetate hydrolase family protein n=1 Tax=Arthrobacter sunyaminii TaxID=2816859 RepID=A0A975S718_9MICC|nr:MULTISPECIES: fumarylacetoacetate hydrolase family protein [Arthrobacter]MBO0896247.1 fumarylacetoacetate hydrolase family protein [Arthrobacter sunyaminii]MBO0907954.1 fumarylacetoacetate hydrolase family protein [Arthrobacter sunyaminii]QWQ37000.1 fumarylacetoacetate hydrolase family protein [Arthrobacter sunyaminii]
MTATIETAPAYPAGIAELAARLRRAERDGTPIEPIRDLLADGGISAAYDVQRTNEDAWIAEGRRVVGRKIGLTSRAVQAQMGVDQPDFGVLFADMCLADGEALAAGAVLQPRVEAEVALVLKRDLPEPDTTLTELIAAVDYLLPAIEIVGSRITNWDISILDTIADNASSGQIVTGTRPVAPSSIDLAAAGMVMEVNGSVESVGSGAACLGHPYRAALWLVRRMAELERPLKAGEILMTGALGPMVAFPPGANAVVNIQGLGQVRIKHEEK